VSIAGNLALMKVMVGEVHMNYLIANGIAVAVCSVANFLVSEKWVFGERTRTPSRGQGSGADEGVRPTRREVAQPRER
jgi:putative flippase GtrA